MDYTSAKRMEDFAQTIIDASPSTQKKMWDALTGVLTPDEVHGLKCYVGLYHLLTDKALYKAVRDSVGEQIYNDAHKGGKENV